MQREPDAIWDFAPKRYPSISLYILTLYPSISLNANKTAEGRVGPGRRCGGQLHAGVWTQDAACGHGKPRLSDGPGGSDATVTAAVVELAAAAAERRVAARAAGATAIHQDSHTVTPGQSHRD